MGDVEALPCYRISSYNSMLRKGLNNLKGNFLKTRPARQYAPSACFFSKSGTKPHRNPEGPPNSPNARKRLISLGFHPVLSHLGPENPTFRGLPLFLLHSVSGQRRSYRSARTDKAPAGYHQRGALGIGGAARVQKPKAARVADRFLQVDKHAYRINPDDRSPVAPP